MLLKQRIAISEMKGEYKLTEFDKRLIESFDVLNEGIWDKLVTSTKTFVDKTFNKIICFGALVLGHTTIKAIADDVSKWNTLNPKEISYFNLKKRLDDIIKRNKANIIKDHENCGFLNESDNCEIVEFFFNDVYDDGLNEGIWSNLSTDAKANIALYGSALVGIGAGTVIGASVAVAMGWATSVWTAILTKGILCANPALTKMAVQGGGLAGAALAVCGVYLLLNAGDYAKNVLKAIKQGKSDILARIKKVPTSEKMEMKYGIDPLTNKPEDGIYRNIDKRNIDDVDKESFERIKNDTQAMKSLNRKMNKEKGQKDLSQKNFASVITKSVRHEEGAYNNNRIERLENNTRISREAMRAVQGAKGRDMENSIPIGKRSKQHIEWFGTTKDRDFDPTKPLGKNTDYISRDKSRNKIKDAEDFVKGNKSSGKSYKERASSLVRELMKANGVKWKENRKK